MEVVLKIDWPNHQHTFKTHIVTLDHYVDEAVKFCTLCEEIANQSGIPTRQHYKHPKGCKCYWCVYCTCPELYKRETG